MSLSHVLLGLLASGPRTGYDLARALSQELDPIWRAEFSQIYPTLARLRRAEFVLLRVLGPRRGPRRNLYRITAAGRRELRRWVAEPAPPPRMKDEGLARLAFLDALPLLERRGALAAHESAVTEEIRRLRAARPLEGYRQIARRGVLERLEASRRWVRTVAAQAPSLEPQREEPGSRGRRE